jgi:uncharacterized protein (DUF305 family)
VRTRGARPAGLLAVLGVLLGALMMAGCADVPVAPPADPLAADVAYARAMIPHHEQALELTTLVGGRSADPRVPELALRIDREQVEEVGQLQGLLRSWGRDPAGAMAPGMDGMASPETMARLGASSGQAFDRLWLETMIAHHEGATAMARGHLATGTDATLRRFSETVVRGQGQEIDMMRAVLGTAP